MVEILLRAIPQPIWTQINRVYQWLHGRRTSSCDGAFGVAVIPAPGVTAYVTSYTEEEHRRLFPDLHAQIERERNG